MSFVSDFDFEIIGRCSTHLILNKRNRSTNIIPTIEIKWNDVTKINKSQLNLNTGDTYTYGVTIDTSASFIDWLF